MTYSNQTTALEDIRALADNGLHSILIAGFRGVGKTYLAKEFAKMKGINDFVVIEPNVGDLRNAIDECISIHNDLVICIENLDRGNVSASYALLKFIEEPPENIYIVITCRNIEDIPDTIISRVSVVNVRMMRSDDLIQYSNGVDPAKHNILMSNMPLWNCVRTTSDIDDLMKLGQDEYDQIMQTESILFSHTSVSGILWKLQKFKNGQSVPIELALQYVMNTATDTRLFCACYNCIKDIQRGRIAQHAALAKLCFVCKYEIGYTQ